MVYRKSSLKQIIFLYSFISAAIIFFYMIKLLVLKTIFLSHILEHKGCTYNHLRLEDRPLLHFWFPNMYLVSLNKTASRLLRASLRARNFVVWVMNPVISENAHVNHTPQFGSEPTISWTQCKRLDHYATEIILEQHLPTFCGHDPKLTAVGRWPLTYL